LRLGLIEKSQTIRCELIAERAESLPALELVYEFIESQSKDITFAQLKDDKIFIEFNSYIMKSLAYVIHDIKKRRRISYQQIISFDKHIVPLLKDKYDNETFLFCVKMFLRALERLAIEHNYILQLSKH